MAEEPILCFDGDNAGLKAAFRAIDTALPLIGPGRTLRFALLPGGQDPDELLRSGGPAAVAAALEAPLPLVELLWMRETEGRPIDTPERRAALERRLSEVAGQIADEPLRRHYAQELSSRLAGLFGPPGDSRGRVRNWSPRGRATPPGAKGAAKGAKSGRSGNPAAAGPLHIGASLANSPLFRGVKPALPPREALILLIFMNHPRLLASHIEEAAALEFASAEAAQLRDLLLRRVEAGEERPDELARAIEEAGLSPLRERLAGMVAHSTLWSVRADAAPADAAETLRQALVLHRREWALNRDLRSVEARLAVNPSEQDSARLRDIQTQLSALDGTEAAVEGFGASSGRASREL
jgi:DNA primase